MAEHNNEAEPSKKSKQGKKTNKDRTEALQQIPTPEANQVQKPEKKSKDLANTSSGAFAVFTDIGKILAPALKENAPLAALVLIFMFAAIVTCVAVMNKEVEGLYLFFALLAGAGLIVSAFLFLLYRRQVEKDKVKLVNAANSSQSLVQFTSSSVPSTRSTQMIQEILRRATEDVAETLHLPGELVRANIFFMGLDNKLEIAHNLTYNMNHEPELSVSIPPGYGSTGRCFNDNKPNIAIFREDRGDIAWGRNVLDDREMKKLHPELMWIISIPVMANLSGTLPLCVFNVDGLQEKKTQLELGEAVTKLFSWSHLISLALAPEKANGDNHGDQSA